jgi:hypothetical protein
MERSLLADVVVLFGVGVCPVLEEQFDQADVLVHYGDVQGSAAVDVAAVDIGLLV